MLIYDLETILKINLILFIYIFSIYIIYKLYTQNSSIEQSIDEMSSNKYYLGEVVQDETLEKEYKEFCIKKVKYINRHKKIINYDLEEENIINFALSGTITNEIMDLIYSNIHTYMKLVPKYVSSYINSKISGELIIGINDEDNEVSGIPYLTSYKKKLTVYTIKRLVKDEIKNNIKCINVNDNDIIDAIDVELIEIDYKSGISSDYLKYDDNEVKTQLKNYLQQKKDYYDKIEKFKKDKIENWCEYFKKYHVGLQVFIDDLDKRKELANYIKKFNDKGQYDNIIYELHQKHKIIVPSGNIVKILKIQNNNLIYWLTQYRDLMKEKVILCKPKKPLLTLTNCIYPEILLRRFSLIKNTICNNKINKKNGLKYYMIKIKINGENFKNKSYQNMCVKYRNTIKNKHSKSWITGYRCIINEDPYCAFEL